MYPRVIIGIVKRESCKRTNIQNILKSKAQLYSASLVCVNSVHDSLKPVCCFISSFLTSVNAIKVDIKNSC